MYTALKVGNHEELTFKPHILKHFATWQLAKHVTKLVLQDPETFPFTFTWLLGQLVPLAYH